MCVVLIVGWSQGGVLLYVCFGLTPAVYTSLATGVHFEFRLIEQSLCNLSHHYERKFVQVPNLYDLRAVGPEKYVDCRYLLSFS